MRGVPKRQDVEGLNGGEEKGLFVSFSFSLFPGCKAFFFSHCFFVLFCFVLFFQSVPCLHGSESCVCDFRLCPCFPLKCPRCLSCVSCCFSLSFASFRIWLFLVSLLVHVVSLLSLTNLLHWFIVVSFSLSLVAFFSVVAVWPRLLYF